MAEEKGTITQEELDRILTVYSNVHKDNDENEKRGEPAGKLTLSQAELDSVLAQGPSESWSADPNESKAEKPALSKEEAARIRARKIAERKAHSAQILAQVKAGAPRRIIVSYGSCVKRNSDIEKLKEGDTIELDRKNDDSMKIYVDGKFFAEGVLVEKAGAASVKLTKLASKGGR